MQPGTQKRLTADEVGVEDGVKLSPCGFQHVGCMQCIGEVLRLHAHADQHVVSARIRELPWQHLCKPGTPSMFCTYAGPCEEPSHIFVDAAHEPVSNRSGGLPEQSAWQALLRVSSWGQMPDQRLP